MTDTTATERCLQGAGASGGVGVGPVVVLRSDVPDLPSFDDPEAAFSEAMTGVGASLKRLSEEAAANGREEAGDVLRAQSMMAEDPTLADSVNDKLRSGADLSDALGDAARELHDMLAAMPDEYLAARAPDILEIEARLRRRLAGLPDDEGVTLEVPTILLAVELTAAQTARLDPELVLGFATETGGPTSHVAIIARSLGVPAAVGVTGLVAAAEHAQTAAIDGDSGEVVLDPEAASVQRFATRADEAAALDAIAAQFQGRRVTFADASFTVAANVANPADVERAVAAASDGIGLFRTEFLFLERATPPTEEEQFEIYAAAARAFDDPVVIRTFDIGGDKPADFLELAPEENPFLGLRGVRLYETFEDLFLTQARALVRAAAEGPVWAMIPMIATVSEMLTVRRLFDVARAQVEEAGHPTGQLPLGAMVEVPSAALIADALAVHAEFFSIGTNDLTQYALAADRMQPELALLHDPLHPAVLRLCQLTAAAAKRHGRPVGVCGLAASDPVAATLFAGMGIDKLSVSPPSVNRVKSAIAGLDEQRARDASLAAVDAIDAAQARAIGSELLPQASAASSASAE